MKSTKPLSLVTMLLGFCLYGVLPLYAQDELPVSQIDHLIRAEWNKNSIVPSPPTDDAHYLRRLYLDVIGTIPTADEVKAFLANRSPYKRYEALAHLLNSPKYVEYWANYWDDVLLGRQVKRANVDRTAFRDWLKGQVSKNNAYNKFVYELLTASGVNTSLASTVMPNGVMPSMESDLSGKSTLDSRVNGAVNFYLKYANTPADYSGTVSRLFLGVQIQCAQCHDHKTEAWKQADFRRFTACFMQAKVQPVNRTLDKKRTMQVELTDNAQPFKVPARLAGKVKDNGRTEYAMAEPAALDGTSFATEGNRRQAIAKWITAPQNPWFAAAIVNRMWAHFLGRGFVNPIDDFRDSNPPVMPELLRKLAEDFVAHGYDLKYLIKLICSTQVYQLSSLPAKHLDEGNTYWARYRLKPLKPEVLMDMLVSATSMQSVLERVAGDRLPAVKAAMQKQLTFLFDVDEEFEQKDYEGTIPQALLLLNGGITNNSVTPLSGTALSDVLSLPGTDKEKIESLYLRTFSRLPNTKEVAYWTKFLNAPREVGQTPIRQGSGLPKQQAYEDMFWGLLNSSEFIFNH